MFAAAALLILLLAGFGIAKVLDDKPTKETTTTPSGALMPATEAEKQESEARKDQIVEEQKSQSSTQSGTKTVTVVITDASSSGVRGYVQGVFEDGGTCTATATQGSQTLTKSSTGFENVSYTQCSPINWSLSGGTWTVNLSYKSAAASGSASRTVEVR